MRAIGLARSESILSRALLLCDHADEREPRLDRAKCAPVSRSNLLEGLLVLERLDETVLLLRRPCLSDISRKVRSPTGALRPLLQGGATGQQRSDDVCVLQHCSAREFCSRKWVCSIHE